MADAEITIIAGQIIGQDVAATIRQSLHVHAQDLIDLEVPLIRARSPYLTGALRDDIKGIPYATGDDIALLYADDAAQLAQWGRIYAPYQEGPPLGLSTWTNPPHQMFANVLTEDIPVIEQWAIEAAQEAIGQCTQGTGIPSTE